MWVRKADRAWSCNPWPNCMLSQLIRGPISGCREFGVTFRCMRYMRRSFTIFFMLDDFSNFLKLLWASRTSLISGKSLFILVLHSTFDRQKMPSNTATPRRKLFIFLLNLQLCDWIMWSRLDLKFKPSSLACSAIYSRFNSNSVRQMFDNINPSEDFTFDPSQPQSRCPRKSKMGYSTAKGCYLTVALEIWKTRSIKQFKA